MAAASDAGADQLSCSLSMLMRGDSFADEWENFSLLFVEIM